MTQYLMTMLAGIGTLILAPVPRDRVVRNTSRTLAGIVFAIGLVGVVATVGAPGA